MMMSSVVENVKELKKWIRVKREKRLEQHHTKGGLQGGARTIKTRRDVLCE